MPTKRKKATRKKAAKAKRKPVASKSSAKKKKVQVGAQIINFEKYLKNKKELKGLKEQVLKEYKSDTQQIVQIKKLLSKAKKAA